MKLNLGNVKKKVWAFYHPFYGTPKGPTGKWLTWNAPVRFGRGYGWLEKGDEKLYRQLKDYLQHDCNLHIGPNQRDCYSAYYPTLGDLFLKLTKKWTAKWKGS